MPQRAIIGINGDLLPFDETLHKLRTPGVGGSAVTWVPDADTICDQLSVTANGSYSAADAGKYGYDYVIVSVPGSSVTGRDPDTGEEVEVHTGPDGEIVETVVPTEIRVTTPPTKTEYTEGETINMTGAIIKAYSATGAEMMTVPLNEISINPAVAHKADTTSIAYNASDLEGTYVKNPLDFVTSLKMQYTSYPARGVVSVNASSGYFLTIPNGYYWVSDRDAVITETGAGDYERSAFIEANVAHIDGQTVEIAARAATSSGTVVDQPTYPTFPAGNETLRDMYRLLYMNYGTDVETTITVSWPRTPDGAVLETSFNITVN